MPTEKGLIHEATLSDEAWQLIEKGGGHWWKKPEKRGEKKVVVDEEEGEKQSCGVLLEREILGGETASRREGEEEEATKDAVGGRPASVGEKRFFTHKSKRGDDRRIQNGETILQEKGEKGGSARKGVAKKNLKKKETRGMHVVAGTEGWAVQFEKKKTQPRAPSVQGGNASGERKRGAADRGNRGRGGPRKRKDIFWKGRPGIIKHLFDRVAPKRTKLSRSKGGVSRGNAGKVIEKKTQITDSQRASR